MIDAKREVFLCQGPSLKSSAHVQFFLATLGSVAASTLRRLAAVAAQLSKFDVATLGNIEASLLTSLQ